MNDLVTHSTDAFTWSPKTRRFIGECSDFGSSAKSWTEVPEGKTKTAYCALRNPATGNEVVFVFLHTIESDGPDYEIEAWVFGATPEECEKNPRLFGVELHFIND